MAQLPERIPRQLGAVAGWPGSRLRVTPPGRCAGAASSRACAEAAPRDRRGGRRCSRCRSSSPSRRRRTGGTPHSNAPRCPANMTAASSLRDRSGWPKPRTKRSPCRLPLRKRVPRAPPAASPVALEPGAPYARGLWTPRAAKPHRLAPTSGALPRPLAAASPWT